MDLRFSNTQHFHIFESHFNLCFHPCRRRWVKFLRNKINQHKIWYDDSTTRLTLNDTFDRDLDSRSKWNLPNLFDQQTSNLVVKYKPIRCIMTQVIVILIKGQGHRSRLRSNVEKILLN